MARSKPFNKLLKFPSECVCINQGWTDKIDFVFIHRFPPDIFFPFVRYAKIAALICTRSIRDVAVRFNALAVRTSPTLMNVSNLMMSAVLLFNDVPLLSISSYF